MDCVMAPAGSRELSRTNFSRLSRLIGKCCGIKMPDNKRAMLQSRLQKRIRALGMGSINEYCDYVFSSKGIKDELHNMINAVTTNKTDFFREPRHYEFLSKTVLPWMTKRTGSRRERPLNIWSAGCSTGEEPYTLAMVLEEFAVKHPWLDYRILGTDVSTKALETARLGIYRRDRVAPVPEEVRRKYILESKDREKGLVRVAPEIRSRVRFERVNFMDENYPVRERMDIIFFRNVLIYFERSMQETVISRLCRHLTPEGYMFVGHSEAIHGLNAPLRQVAPSVYRRV